MELLSGELPAHPAEVLGVNLILSGDNAVVIATAVRGPDGANRRGAISQGTGPRRPVCAAAIAFLLLAWSWVRRTGEAARIRRDIEQELRDRNAIPVQHLSVAGTGGQATAGYPCGLPSGS